MMKRVLVLAILVVALITLIAVLASPASAVQVTKMGYYQTSITYDTHTPTEAGEYRIEIRWANAAGVIPPDGSTGPGYPDSEVDVVVQGYDKVGSTYQPYVDIDVATLYEGTNPQEGLVAITKANGRINKPIYFGAVGWITDRAYRMRVWWTPASTGVETLVVDRNDTAYGDGGQFEMLATSGEWHSVIQAWAGTLNRATGASNVTSNWDDYVMGRNSSDPTLADNWLPSPTLDDMVAPLVTNSTIPGTGPYAAIPGWYIAGPEIWTAAALPNVWGNILTDTYPKPGSVTWDQCPAWYTYSYPEARVTTEKPTYFWAMTNIAQMSGRSASSESQNSATLKYRFYGPSFKWVYMTTKKGGIHSVKVDGTEAAQVNQYSNGTVTQVTREFTGFGAAAYHDVVIQNVGQDPLSTGLWMYHDAFIGKTDPDDPYPAALRQNNVDGSTSYTWGTASVPGSVGGTISTAKATNAAIAYTFNKTAGLNSFTWNFLKTRRAGTWKVLIDGVQFANVDQYAASTALASQAINISTLADGWHTIIILNNGFNPASIGSWCYHDAFVFGTTTVDN